MPPQRSTEMIRLLRKMAYGEHLRQAESGAALDTIESVDRILSDDHSDGIYFAAFTFGLMARGPTVEELAGIVDSIGRKSVRFDVALPRRSVIDVSGTGGDRLKTINVGSLASFVIAAGGGIVAKQATRSYTGPTGSSDVFAALGLDVTDPDEARLKRLLHETGVAAFYTPAFTNKFDSRLAFLRKLNQLGFTYPTPWHLVAWVYSPIDMANRLYGVFDDRYRTVLAELFKRRGYERVMVVHGEPGIDEISVVGETSVTEISNDVQREYVLTPAELGLDQASEDAVSVYTRTERHLLASSGATRADLQRMRKRVLRETPLVALRVLYGEEKGAQQALVAANAGAGLYLCGQANTLRDGVRMGIELLDTGAVRRRVELFADTLGTRPALERLRRKAGVE